jgi:hypothetical protein
MRCRHAVIYPWWNHQGGIAFHNNFWSNIEMDLDSGCFVEKENILPTPELLYKMTDPDFMVQTLKDDLMIQLYLVGQVKPSSLDVNRINVLAEILGVPSIDESNLQESAERIKMAYGFAATKLIIQKAWDFCQNKGKNLMILLLCPRATRQLLDGQLRYEQDIVDYLDAKGFPYFDMNLVHLKDYKSFNLSVEDYMKRYYIGHYSPAGNHFFAYSIKDPIVNWLNPKPITYRDDGQRI